MLDVIWLNLVELSKQETFNQLLEKVTENEKDWKCWCDTEAPEEEEIPCGYNNALDVFRKLLLIRAWSVNCNVSNFVSFVTQITLLETLV